MSKFYDEHENWIRMWAVGEARQIHKFSSSTDKVLEEAKKIERYVLNTPDAEVIPLAIITSKPKGIQ
jgi:hypothetical protein